MLGSVWDHIRFVTGCAGEGVSVSVGPSISVGGVVLEQGSGTRMRLKLRKVELEKWMALQIPNHNVVEKQ